MGESKEEEGRTQQKKLVLRIRKDIIKKLVESNRSKWGLWRFSHLDLINNIEKVLHRQDQTNKDPEQPKER